MAPSSWTPEKSKSNIAQLARVLEYSLKTSLEFVTENLSLNPSGLALKEQ